MRKTLSATCVPGYTVHPRLSDTLAYYAAQCNQMVVPALGIIGAGYPCERMFPCLGRGRRPIKG
jgi:hypothetical protein